uniref:Histidine-containing phosphotransfer protein n=1 Tax=Ananas comosus var. bracteatus TaxID=296719 RepID=A0A6V7QSE1_ANACO
MDISYESDCTAAEVEVDKAEVLAWVAKDDDLGGGSKGSGFVDRASFRLIGRRQDGSTGVDAGVGRGSLGSRHEPFDGPALPPGSQLAGVLDEQFMQLQQLQDDSSPNFVLEVISIYFRESEKMLTNLRHQLADKEVTDYTKIGVHLNHLMGSSSSIGANRITTVCIALRAASEQCSWARCLRCLEVLEHEYCYLKARLHELFQVRYVLTCRIFIRTISDSSHCFRLAGMWMEQQRVIAAGVRYRPQLA